MNPFKAIITDRLGSVIRTGIATGGGFLIGKGIVDAETGASIADSLTSASTELVAGLVMWGLAQITSLINKKQSK